MKRREGDAPAAVVPTFADYLAACPAPRDGWSTDPWAVEVRASLYVRTYGEALDLTGPPHVLADAIVVDWLRQAPKP